MTWLAVTGVIFSVIGAFYYLRVIKLMYFDAPEEGGDITAGTEFRLLLSINGLLILLLGVFPQGLMIICNQALLR